MSNSAPFDLDVAVIGGCGRVGLPLAITLANCGFKTTIFDVDAARVAAVREGRMPFVERNADAALRTALDSGNLTVDDRPASLSRCQFLVCIIGTPVDEHLNPGYSAITHVLDQCRNQFRDGQILILRSTVYPGTSQRIRDYFHEEQLRVAVAFCPERVAQGHSLEEFRTLPQIISAFEPETLLEVRRLFGPFVPEFVEMTPMEAEFCKLMTNAWRYIQFAAVNQFYMIASQSGCDFTRILEGCRHHYPRMQGMPGPGLTAGPCLVKDTLQLAAYGHPDFLLGRAAVAVNEGLPAHLIEMAKQRTGLRDKTVGVLGMAFKADSDDARDSLSWKLRKLLRFEAARVLCCDPYVVDERLVPLEQVLAESQVLFLAAPHACYRSLSIPPERVVIDVWNCLPTHPAAKPAIGS